MVGVPLHVPVVAVSVPPTVATEPVTVGRAVLAGSLGANTRSELAGTFVHPDRWPP